MSDISFAERDAFAAEIYESILDEDPVVQYVTVPTDYGDIPVVRVDREAIGDAFGICYRFNRSGGTDWLILLRDDLDETVARGVLAHEIGHLGQDFGSGSWIARELTATAQAIRSDPAGVAAAALATLSPTRLRFYAERIRARR